MPRKVTPDMWLFGVAVVLLSAGVVMVYSASAVVAADRFGDPYFFLKKQLFWALLGSVGMLVAVRIDYRRLERFVLPALVLAGVLLVLVLIPPIGQAINGTRRWIRLGPVSFQPAELAKVALVFYLAAFVARRQEEVADVRRGLLPPLLVAGSFAALVLVQPDLGNCLTLVALTFGLLYLAGSPVRYLAWAIAPALPLLALAIYAAPYRLRRVTAFWDPWADPRGSGFQIIQSWLAFGNGGLVGQGIGASRQKLFYLPESHTDFIFAVLVWRGLRVGLRTSEPFGAYLALGITLLIATQTLVNLGVVTGLLPTKGLPLPFISFGGSALSMTMLSTGVLLNISQHAHV